MELAYSLRRARRVQPNSTAPPSPMTPTLITSYGQSPFRSPSGTSTTTTGSSHFKLIDVDEDSGHQLRPLKLPPRLSPCSTPPRPQCRSGRTTAPSWSGLLGFGHSRNKDFDPFAAAVERIREDDRDQAPPRDQRTESVELASRSSSSSLAQNKRNKSGFLAFVGSDSNRKRVFDGADESDAVGWMQGGNCISSSSTMEIVKANGSKAPSVVYKQRLMACFGFKK